MRNKRKSDSQPHNIRQRTTGNETELIDGNPRVMAMENFYLDQPWKSEAIMMVPVGNLYLDQPWKSEGNGPMGNPYHLDQIWK